MTDGTLSDLEYNAVESGIEAAGDAVSALPPGQKKWDMKEYMIAKVAARAALDYYIRHKE